MLKWLETHKKFSWILLILVAVEIFYISSLQFKPGSGGFSITPIIYHFAIFFLFATFLLSSIKGTKKIKIIHLAITLLISFLYATSDEFHQLFVPGRSAGIFDIIIDTTGILFAVVIYLKYEKNPKFSSLSLISLRSNNGKD